MFQKLSRSSRSFCGSSSTTTILPNNNCHSYHSSLFTLKPAKGNAQRITAGRGASRAEHVTATPSFNIASLFEDDQPQQHYEKAHLIRNTSSRSNKNNKRTSTASKASSSVDPSIAREAKDFWKYNNTNNYERTSRTASILPPSFYKDAQQQVFASEADQHSFFSTNGESATTQYFNEEFASLDKTFEDFDQSVSCCDEQFHRAEGRILDLLAHDSRIVSHFGGSKLCVEGRACTFHYLGNDEHYASKSVMDQEITFIGNNKRKGTCHFRVHFYDKFDNSYKISSVFVENELGEKWTIDAAEKLCIESSSSSSSCEEDVYNNRIIDCEFVQKH